MERLRNRVRFVFERWIQAGWLHQFAVIAGTLACIATAAGLLAYGLTDEFDRIGPAIWWGFLRISDPGYLGDDEGAILRTLSLLTTLSGLVFFVGALVAMMNQWLGRTISRLESGLTPIALEGHIVILGWTNRTAPCVRALLKSEERTRRFLRRQGVRSLRIVVLADEVNAERRTELREHVEPHWDERRVLLRMGNSLAAEDLQRVSASDSAAVLIPGSDFELGGSGATDARVVKTLMTLEGEGDPGSHTEVARNASVVAEMLEVEKMPLARAAFGGALELIPGDRTIARLLAQSSRHPGLTYVFEELFSYGGGSEIYIRDASEFVGNSLGDIGVRYANALLLGVVQSVDAGFESRLLPGSDYVVRKGDRLVLVARDYDSTSPGSGRSVGETDLQPGRSSSRDRSPSAPDGSAAVQRLLILGWNHKLPALIEEYEAYPGERFRIDLLSLRARSEQRSKLAEISLSTVEVQPHEGDYTRDRVIEEFDLSQYDHVILLGSERYETGEETDARTILGFMGVERRIRSLEDPPGLLVELVDPDNAGLLETRKEEMMLTPRILSRMLSQVALRPELRSVFGEIFGPGRSEFYFRPVSAFGLAESTRSYSELRALVNREGVRLLGIRYADRVRERTGGVVINPDADEMCHLSDRDELLTLERSA